MAKIKIDIDAMAGKVYGRLFCLGEGERVGKSRALLCVCDCNNFVTVALSQITQGKTRSCGCLRNDELGKRSYVHGLSKHPIYSILSSMKQRCYDSNTENYYLYGARGITICSEWLNSYENFILWSINNGWKKGLIIDRIDNNGNYCPENCRYVTPTQSARNKRNNVKYLYNGVYYSIHELASFSGGIREAVIRQRINRDKLDVYQAVHKPLTSKFHPLKSL